MFCQHCGNELKQGLNYCNRCGARSITDLERTYSLAKSDKVARNLSLATGVSGFAGIVGLGYIVNNMIWRGGEIAPGPFLLVLLLGAVILGVVITLGIITSIAHRKSLGFAPRFQEDAPPRPQFQTAPAVAQLEEKSAPFFSVTENTTRSFEPALVPKEKN